MRASPSTGPIVSANTWGYTSSPGMAGPKLVGTSASTVFGVAVSADVTKVPTTSGGAGIQAN